MYNALHEGNIDDVFKIAKGVASAVDNIGKPDTLASKYSYSSLAKAASSLIAVFPVLASRTISANTTQKISKFIEQKACHLFMLALQQANISNATSGIEYLRAFHQNLDIGSSGVDEVIKTMQTWIDSLAMGGIGESYAGSLIREEDHLIYDSLFEADDIEISARDINNILKAMKENSNIKVYDTQLNDASINDFMVNENGNGKYKIDIKPYRISEARVTTSYSDKYDYDINGNYINSTIINRSDTVEEIPIRDDIRRRYPGASDQDLYRYQLQYDAEEKARRERQTHIADVLSTQQQMRLNRERNRREAEKHGWERREKARKRLKDRRDTADFYWNKVKDVHKMRLDNRKDARDAAKNRREEIEHGWKRDEIEARRASGRNVEILRDQDIKKMNDAVPSLLVVRFYQSQTAIVATEFIIGVKSRVIPVTTPEILRRIMNDNKDGKSFLNFMRTITGEMKASEFLLGISRIKEDLRSVKVKGAYGKVWNLLKNRADAAREMIKHGKRNDFSAITTVLISQSDADELFREENFDITNPSNALHFMDSYNLMGFAIVDEALEVFRILFDDGSKMFEEISFTMLDRESRDGETYKKLVNLIASSR